MSLPTNFEIYLAPLVILVLVLAFFQVRRTQKALRKHQRELESRMYESLILREIGERIGYELNITKILDTIIDSLNKLLPFSVVSYMIISPDGTSVGHKIHIEEVVGPKFLSVVRTHMLDSLNQIAPRRFTSDEVKETISGGVVDDGASATVLSLWITPLVINTRGLGVLAVASRQAGLYHGPEMDLLTKILSQANRAVNNLESVIASEEHRLNALVHSLIDGIIMLDKDLNLLVINPAAAEFLSLPKAAELTIFDIAKSLADRVDLRSKIDEAVKSDRISTIDNINFAEKLCRIIISPVKDYEQKIIGTVVVFHDMTPERELERLRNEFTAMMVHELRAPLSVVRGTTDVIARNPNLATEPAGQELLKTMHSSAESMLSLVNDLLDVSKIEAGKFQIIKTSTNLADVIRDRVTFFNELATGKSITLTADLADNLTANFDRDRIAQVLNNLLSNSLKYTPGGGKITVKGYKITDPSQIAWRFGPKTTFTPAVPAIAISVSDTGVGVDDSELPKLFTKYHQIQPGHAGSGLGLVIAKGIVESHGGAITLESHQNEGTTVHFTIPIEDKPLG